MIVEELIRKLETYPKDKIVALSRGHESAFPIDVDFPSHNGLTKREWMAIILLMT